MVAFTHTLRCALLRCAGKKKQEVFLPAQRSVCVNVSLRLLLTLRPRDVFCHLKSCQMLHTYTKNRMIGEKYCKIAEKPWTSFKAIRNGVVRLVFYHF